MWQNSSRLSFFLTKRSINCLWKSNHRPECGWNIFVSIDTVWYSYFQTMSQLTKLKSARINIASFKFVKGFCLKFWSLWFCHKFGQFPAWQNSNLWTYFNAYSHLKMRLWVHRSRTRGLFQSSHKITMAGSKWSRIIFLRIFLTKKLFPTFHFEIKCISLSPESFIYLICCIFLSRWSILKI